MEVEGFNTLGDICGLTEEQMLEIRNFGKTSLKEIQKKLTERGLSLGMDLAAIRG
jgi:DNA-directed RNA polymerase subunit alpha